MRGISKEESNIGGPESEGRKDEKMGPKAGLPNVVVRFQGVRGRKGSRNA